MGREEPVEQVGAVHTQERPCDVGAICTVIPEEIFPLCQLLAGRCGCEYFFARVWVNSGVIYLGRDCHWGWGEILHLLKMQVELFGLGCEFCHVCFVAAGM